MKIRRKSATAIMSHAIHHQDEALLAVMHDNENLELFSSVKEFEQYLETSRDSVCIYNQNSLALETIERLSFKDGQIMIEVFQDTEGVFGLRAYQFKGKIQTPITLEFTEFDT